jgi:hypothetical protein
VRSISPWERSGEPAAYDGQPPYHLDRFNPAYWARLRGFLRQAQRRGIIVELTIFDDCGVRHGRWDEQPRWEYHPFNSINGGPIIADTQQGAAEFYNLDNAAVRAAQEALVEKLLKETRPFGNVIFEVCNEPYSPASSPQWLQHWVDFIHARDPRLVSVEARGKGALGDVLTLHLGGPERVHAALLQRLRDAKPLIVDETPPYRGPRHDPRGAALHRTAMWTAFVSGGQYDVLDYTWYRNPDYASDGDAVREYQSHLAQFVHRVVPWRMAPRDDVVISAPAKAYALAEPGEAYVVYLLGSAEASQVSVKLDVGRYWVRWFDPKTGKDVNGLTITVPVGGPVTLASPRFDEDMVLLVRKPLPPPKGRIPEDLVPWDL